MTVLLLFRNLAGGAGGAGDIASAEAFGVPRLLGVQQFVRPTGISSAQVFGPVVLGDASVTAADSEPGQSDTRDDELCTLWVRDTALHEVLISESDPLYAVTVSTD